MEAKRSSPLYNKAQQDKIGEQNKSNSSLFNDDYELEHMPEVEMEDRIAYVDEGEYPLNRSSGSRSQEVISISSDDDESYSPAVIYETEHEDSIRETTEALPKVEYKLRESAMADKAKDRTPKIVPRTSSFTRMINTESPESNGRRIPGFGAFTEVGRVAPAMPEVMHSVTARRRPVEGSREEFRSSYNERMVATYQGDATRSDERPAGRAPYATYTLGN